MRLEMGYCCYKMNSFIWILLVVLSLFLNQIKAQETGGDVVKRFRLEVCTPNVNYTSPYSKHCSCNAEVISCDFNSFNGTERTILELLAYWPQDDVKKLCLCNTPKNLQIVLSKNFLSDYHQRLHRIDFYDFKGPLWIHDAFSIHFSGDIFMSKVKLLRSIFSYEFGRGVLHVDELTDTSNLQCCSKIQTMKFKSPTFYVENSTIDIIQSSGINAGQLWSNLIFDNVQFNHVERYGIEINNYGLNASFTNCIFHNVSETGIAVNELSNLLVAHSKFGPWCHPAVFGARAIDINSTVVFIQNEFHMNDTILEIDGNYVGLWFNYFNKWSSKTFQHLNGTTRPNRVVSIEFNSVESFELKESDIPILKAYDNKVIFNENLIIHCSCSKFESLQLPSLLKNFTQRCHSDGRKKGNCHLTISEVQAQCKKSGNPDYEKLCQNDNAHSKMYANAKLLKSLFKAHSFPYSFKLEANGFIMQMLQNVKSPFGVPTLEAESKPGEPKKEKPSKKSTSAKITWIVLSIIVLLIIGLILIYRERERLRDLYSRCISGRFDDELLK